MNEETREIKLTQINIRETLNFLSCALALFPSIFTDFCSGWSTNVLLSLYVISIILAVWSVSSKHSLEIRISTIRPILLWLVVVFICVLNRNGDISQSYYRPILNFIFIFFFTTFFVSQNMLFVKNIIRVMIIYLLAHLVVGFYFWINPKVMLQIGSTFFRLSTAFNSKFVSFVNNGAFMGFTSHYSTSGMYMALAVVLLGAFVYAYRKFYFKWNLWYTVAFVAFFLALGLTQKRGHLLFSVIAIIGMYLVGYVSGSLNKKLTQIIFFIILGGLALIAIFQIPAFQAALLRFAKADSLDEASNNRITSLWLPAWEEFKKNPFLGIGWHQFKYLHPMSNGIKNDVHNIYIQFLAEDGIIGAGYIIGLMVYTYISTWKLLLKSKYTSNRDEYLYLMFSFGYQTFFILYGLTGNPFFDIQCFFPYMISCSITYFYQNKYKKKMLETKVEKNDTIVKSNNKNNLLNEGIG